CMNDESRLMQYYGATKDPETGDFIIVMQFIYDGSLKNFLDKNEIQYGWQWKLNILHYLAQDLNTIHDAGLFHNDVKNENVFVLSDWKEELTEEEFIIGKADDIHGFGIVMIEIATENYVSEVNYEECDIPKPVLKLI